MEKQEKWNRMCSDLENMDEHALLEELKNMQVTCDIEEIYERLSKTYNDLDVSDWIFAHYPVDDRQSKYPKEFVDEAITRLAMLHEFPFTHYGIISSRLYALHDPLISDQLRLQGYREVVEQFLHMCKKFHLDHFDQCVYTIHDGLDMGKEIVALLDLLHKQGTDAAHHQAVQLIERMFRTFSIMNPWLEEQLFYAQAENLIALRSGKGEKQFQQLVQTASDPNEAIYRYVMCYPKDKNKQKNLVKRYQRQMDEQSEYAKVLKKLNT